MTSNLLFNNDLTYNNIIISCSFILGCSLFYIIRSNYTAIPSNNIEALTNQEIEAIINENSVTIINTENIDAIYDSDSSTVTDLDSEYQSTFDSDSDSSSVFEDILEDPNLTFLSNVDFNVCSLQELKHFELCSLYAREIEEHFITYEDVREFISWFPDANLLHSSFNQFFVDMISLL